jgi:hypothetical protein
MLSTRHHCSAQEAVALLNCRRLPGRLNSAEAALLLGFQEHDISTLVMTRLLAPLGKPASNAPKYFAAVEVEALARDREWLGQATKALAKYWVVKNHRKKTGFHGGAVEADGLRAA